MESNYVPGTGGPASGPADPEGTVCTLELALFSWGLHWPSVVTPIA